jgi:tRNA threonylcarbamoyladenosine biosynthesis protein TsaE
MRIIKIENEKETFSLGMELGRNCCGGEVFALCGNLGAGKTKLTQGIAAGLGVAGRVNSPTFNILKVYRVTANKNLGKKIKTLCHIDAYRLESGRDLEALGIREFFDSAATVTVIEWAEKVKEIWPKGIRVIKIETGAKERRRIKVY